ncbi:MAG: N-acetylmuramoyl-L-alanine amidase [Propionibacteriaceae bacterium]|jgi:hypothetical protein|nr:N-acetylmuramoyl-L-alanine amidase [Propionibacteriaceae bacterium]
MGFNDLVFPFHQATRWSERPAGPGVIKGTVLHHAVATNFAAVRATFQSPTATTSAHYGVWDVSVEQYVHDWHEAWANGSDWHNAHCVSIEHVNSTAAWPYPLAANTLVTGARLVAAIHRFYGCGRPEHGVNVWKHKEVADPKWATECPGAYFENNLKWYIGNAQHYYDTQDYDSDPPFKIFDWPGTGGSGDVWTGGSSGGNSSGGSLDMRYMVKTQAHGWLPEVLNLTDYAGWQDSPITDVAMSFWLGESSTGSMWYQVHLLGGGWLPPVTGYNTADHNNGYAGMGNGQPIDAIRAYINSPQGNRVVAYRVAPVGQGYYDWQRDDETTNGQDGYAGAFGVKIGKLQAHITAY